MIVNIKFLYHKSIQQQYYYRSVLIPRSVTNGYHLLIPKWK